MACLIVFAFFAHTAALQSAPSEVRFSQSANRLDAYDFLEIELTVANPDARNPFTDAGVQGWCSADGGRRVNVDGFCDSPDGNVFRIRFMPTETGRHDYSVTYRQGEYEATHRGSFEAVDGQRKGIVRVDEQHSFHFVWEGTGEHYFCNGATTSANGQPALSTRADQGDFTPVCGLINEGRDLAVVYLPTGGSIAIKPKTFAREFNAKWYNPRTSQWSAATAEAKSTFAAPDEMDWVLLLRAK